MKLPDFKRTLKRIDPAAGAVAGLGVLFGIVFSRLNILMLYSFFSFEYQDAAVEHQLLYNVATSGTFIQTIFFTGSPDHFWPIAYLIAPFYRLYPSIETWFVLVSFSYGLSALVFFAIARDLSLSKTASFLIATAYLLYPPLHFAALASVDGGRNFALPLLALTIYFMQRRRHLPYLLCLLLALMCKEDMALIGLGFGGYLYFRRYPAKWWRSTLILSTLYLMIALAVLRWAFDPWPVDRGPLIGIPYIDGAGVRHFFLLISRHMNDAFEVAFHPTKVRAILALFWPLLFLPWGAVETLIPASSFIVLSFAKPHFYNQNADYLAPLIPFVFLGLCHALSKIKRKRLGEQRSRAISAAIIILCLAQQSTRTLLGQNAEESRNPSRKEAAIYDRGFKNVTSIFDRRLYTIEDEDTRALALVRRIPPEASVTASGSFLPLLSGRRILYEFGSHRGAALADRRLEKAKNYSVDVILIDLKCRVNGLGGTYICPDDSLFEQELNLITRGYRYHKVYDDGDFLMFSSPQGLKHPRPFNADPRYPRATYTPR